MKYDTALEARLQTAMKNAITRVLLGGDEKTEVAGDVRSHVICVCPDCAKPRQLAEVSEDTAMKGGRWVSADDVERMAGELVSFATGEPVNPVKMVDAYHILKEHTETVEKAVQSALEVFAGAHVVHPSIVGALTGLFNEQDGGWTPDAIDHLKRLRTLLGMHGAPFVSDFAKLMPEAAFQQHGYRQGTKEAVAFNNGARWANEWREEPAKAQAKAATPEEAMFYILDSSSRAGRATWWADGGFAYVDSIHNAGRFTRQYCETACASDYGSIPWPCSDFTTLPEDGQVDVSHLPRNIDVQRINFWKKG